MKAKKKVTKPKAKVDPIYEVLCSIESEIQALGAGISALSYAINNQPQKEKVELLVKLVEGQKALSDTIMLLTAKGVAKAPKEKKVEPATPQQIVEGVNQAGREMAQDQRDRLAAPAPAPEEKRPTLSVVPPVAPASAGSSPGPSSEPVKAPTLDELRTAFLGFIAKHTREKGIDLLKNFGATKLSDVPPAQYAKFAAACA